MSVLARKIFTAAALMLLQALAHAGEPPPPAPKPWRQFADMPEVLWYESFESEVKPALENCTIHTGAPCLPNSTAIKLAPHNDVNWKQIGQIKLDSTPAKIPGGVDPKTIFMQTMVWVDEPGEILIWFNSPVAEYNEQEHVPVAKAWVPLNLKFADLSGKVRPAADHVCHLLRFFYKPNKKGAASNVYIDNILITNVVPPAAVLPRILERERKTATLRKKPETDGFNYSLASQEQLQAELKKNTRRKKDKTVLIAPSAAIDAAQLKQQLESAAQKHNAQGISFELAQGPNGSAVAGMDDMRSLISYSLNERDSQSVLFVLSPADLLGQGKPDENVQALVYRAISAGCTPIVCLPAVRLGSPDSAKLSAANTSVTGLCNQMGVPWLDQNFALKNIPGAFEGEKLTAQGVEGIAALASVTIKHFFESIRK